MRADRLSHSATGAIVGIISPLPRTRGHKCSLVVSADSSVFLMDPTRKYSQLFDQSNHPACLERSRKAIAGKKVPSTQSAGGAKDLSPARERWEPNFKNPKRRRCDRYFPAAPRLPLCSSSTRPVISLRPDPESSSRSSSNNPLAATAAEYPPASNPAQSALAARISPLPSKSAPPRPRPW